MSKPATFLKIPVSWSFDGCNSWSLDFQYFHLSFRIYINEDRLYYTAYAEDGNGVELKALTVEDAKTEALLLLPEEFQGVE